MFVYDGAGRLPGYFLSYSAVPGFDENTSAELTVSLSTLSWRTHLKSDGGSIRRTMEESS